MRRTSLSLLILALLAGACSDDDVGPQVYRPDELRVRVVSGDAQTGQVASADDASLSVSTAASLQTVPPGLEVLDRPLVVQLVTESGQRVMGASIPPRMRAAWIVEDQGCGRPFHGDTDFDAEGQATNLWIVGTKAGVECTMYAGRIVGGQVVIDSVFVAEFEPGPVVRLTHVRPSQDIVVQSGEVIDWRDLITGGGDAHGNLIGPDVVRATVPDSLIRWQWVDRANRMARQPEQSGWTITAPDFAADGFKESYTGTGYAPGLYIWHAHHMPLVLISFVSPLAGPSEQ